MKTVGEAKHIAQDWVEAEAPIIPLHLPSNLQSAVILNCTPSRVICYLEIMGSYQFITCASPHMMTFANYISVRVSENN